MPNEYHGCDGSQQNRGPDAVVDEVHHACATLLTSDCRQRREVTLERIAPRYHPHDDGERKDEVEATQHPCVNFSQFIPGQVTCDNRRKRGAEPELKHRFESTN